MGAFRYYFGFLYIVYHEKKGFWNSDVKKYVNNPMRATLYKNVLKIKRKNQVEHINICVVDLKNLIFIKGVIK